MFIIISILSFLLIIGSIVLFISTDNKGIATMMLVIGIIGFFIGGSVDFVPTGYVGIKTAFGQISGETVSSGLIVHIPFIENIHRVNCKQQEIVFEGQIWSETSERTELYVENPVIDYQIRADEASWIWQNVEEYDTQLVKRTSVESGIKASTKQYNDVDVTDRSKIEKIAKEFIQKALDDKYGKCVVDVVAVTFPNMNFSDAYNKAIEDRAQKKLAAETAEYENQRITSQKEAEAEQRKIEAESKAEAKKIEAEANAEARKIEAEAEAEANRKISDSITNNILINKALENNEKYIDKWNGQTPIVTSGSDSSFIYDMKDIEEMVNE